MQLQVPRCLPELCKRGPEPFPNPALPCLPKNIEINFWCSWVQLPIRPCADSYFHTRGAHGDVSRDLDLILPSLLTRLLQGNVDSTRARAQLAVLDSQRGRTRRRTTEEGELDGDRSCSVFVVSWMGMREMGCGEAVEERGCVAAVGDCSLLAGLLD